MKRSISLALLLGLTAAARADYTANFDNIPLGANSANEGPYSLNTFADSVGNTYNNIQASYGSYNYWAGGWAVSNITNTANPGGLIPDYNFIDTAITGKGYNGDTNYAIGSTYGTPGDAIIDLAPGTSPVSIQVTNSAYAYYSMIYGDSLVTPFTSNDFLRLTVQGYTEADGGGSLVGGPVTFNLAGLQNNDGQFTIFDTWQKVQLGSLAGSQSLVFSLTSSQNNELGSLVPGFFAADALVTASSVPEPASLILCLSGFGLVAALRRTRR